MALALARRARSATSAATALGRSLRRAGAASASAPPPPPPPPPRAVDARSYALWEDVKDVVAVTFGWTRARDVGREVDLGLRAYAWFTYAEPGTGRTVFRNVETGAVTETPPPDWERRATPASYLVVNEGASALAAAPGAPPSAWERSLAAVRASPLLAAALDAGGEVAAAVRAGPVGRAAAAAAARVADAREDAREAWETSQHPLVVNASYAVDSLLAETESGRAMHAIRALDAGFDEVSFLADMRDAFLPALARAFFRLDFVALRAVCRDSAMAQLKAVQAARAVEGLSHDGLVLAVSKVELLQARSVDAGEAGGTMPVIVVSAQVQYIHTVRGKKGDIVEGSESEIRAGMFVVALTRETVPATGELAWRVVELAMHGNQLYL